MRKEDLFFDWITGGKSPFPFFRDMPEVKMPEVYRTKPDEEEEDERLAKLKNKLANDEEDAMERVRNGEW